MAPLCRAPRIIPYRFREPIRPNLPNPFKQDKHPPHNQEVAAEAQRQLAAIEAAKQENSAPSPAPDAPPPLPPPPSVAKCDIFNMLDECFVKKG